MSSGSDEQRTLSWSSMLDSLPRPSYEMPGDAVRDMPDLPCRYERRLRRGIESQPLPITFWDADGQVTEPNDAYLDLIGYTRQDLRERSLRWQDITAPEHVHLASEAVAELRATGVCAPFEMEYVRKDGHRVPILVGAALLPDGDAEAVSFALDLTERERTEHPPWQGAQAHDQFFPMLAHELRNALAPLAYVIQVARLEEAEERDHVLAIGERQVKLLTRLVNDLLDMSRIRSGKLTLHTESMDLRGIVEQAVESSRFQLAAHDHCLTLALPPQPVHVKADPLRVAQVLTNLLSNAIKHTEPGGNISLAAEREGDAAVLRVVDTGTGIQPDILPHIFEPFVQSRSAFDHSDCGLGIGLTLVRELVELHGGTVEARSRGAGRGSEFIVRLPALPTAADGSPG
jgi:PAS domain S-box-containing protein